MKNFLYGVATFCAFLALAILFYPILTNLQNLRGGLGALIPIGMAVSVAPFAIGLAVIPLCIAVAFDRVSS